MAIYEWPAVWWILTGAVIGPGFLWFCFDYWRVNRWLSALFLLLCIERFYGLAALDWDGVEAGGVVAGPVPVVLFMAAVLCRLVAGRLLARGLEWRGQRVSEIYVNGQGHRTR